MTSATDRLGHHRLDTRAGVGSAGRLDDLAWLVAENARLKRELERAKAGLRAEIARLDAVLVADDREAT